MGVLSQFELGWLVGILEGEGYFGFPCRTQQLSVTMTDEDTVYRVAGLFERLLGREVVVKAKEPNNPNAQMLHEIVLTGESARIVMQLVVKHMSHRRRQKIWQSLNRFRPPNVDVKKLLGLA